ncbi:MAG: TatD family nuclease-associated radical SAM protein [Candidatus Borkfalkiaceae bacterium]|nr:TatD family nuclease-associated radical SAM protein [Clostridia bacterium]MDY6223375.1 TatD family nuclease-associated radical SAM protein [Christensenellaceae bacterium]
MGKNNNLRRYFGEKAGASKADGNNGNNEKNNNQNNNHAQESVRNNAQGNGSKPAKAQSAAKASGGNKNRFPSNGGNKNKQKSRGQNGAQGNGKGANDENRKDTYVYELDGNIYVNLTNKCSNGCEFCVRNERASYYGNYLWLRHGEPSAEKVIAALSVKDLSAYKELVFCGFGEPTYKMAEMTEIADFAHSKGLKTRLNTNGQGNLINKRDVVPELIGKIDLVNVSLNAPDAESYQKICRSMFRLDAFPALLEFAGSCVKHGVSCRFSVVDCIGEDAVASCRRLAESVGVPLYVRKYIADS